MRIIRNHTVGLAKTGTVGVWRIYCRDCSKKHGHVERCDTLNGLPTEVADAKYKMILERIREEETNPKTLSRTDSPSTSKAAAESLNATEKEQEILDYIIAAGEDGMTADELLIALPKLTYSTVTARPSGLRRKGYIFKAGDKRKGRSGRMQFVHRDIKYLDES